MSYLKPRRRTAKDIVYAITKSAYEGQRKTKIMYSAGLNLSRLNEFLVGLREQGMLSLDDHRVYLTTEKGRRFVRAYEKSSKIREQLFEQERLLSELWSPEERISVKHLAVSELSA